MSEFDLDLVYLPKRDSHAVVKKSYSPDTQKLTSLNDKLGGLSYGEIANELKITELEAEILVQLLLKRNVMTKTVSYLYGEKYYIKG